jgi:hypothetical protein
MEQAMSDSPSLGFGKFVPGFDFLQNLAKGATQNIPQMPNLGNWVAPTLNVEELDKRIDELKAVQFWLDQNAMALKATIQALEVQKMTLATLKGMNFNMGDVANAFKLKAADTVMSGVQKVTDTAAGAAGAVSGVAGAVTGVASGMASMASDVASAATAKRSAAKAEAKAAAAPAGGLVDPLQWWGALTQQFQQIAASAMKDAAKQTAMDTTKHMATGLAKDALKTAGAAVRAPARKAAAKKAAAQDDSLPRARMKRFPSGHATHPQWRMAVALVLAQLRAQMALPEYASAPTLALLYITDHYASDARDILDALAAELPEVTDWAGTVGVGLAANNAEYFDEPALAVMLCDLPPDQYRVFSGVAPLGWASRPTPRWSMPTPARPTWPS